MRPWRSTVDVIYQKEKSTWKAQHLAKITRSLPNTITVRQVNDSSTHTGLMMDLGLHEARDLVENRPLWRLMSLRSATYS